MAVCTIQLLLQLEIDRLKVKKWHDPGFSFMMLLGARRQ
jgi:hypothetical protein